MNKIIFHGHSFVELHLKGFKILIDPFITGNPLCDIKSEKVSCDYIILTHGHGDHFGDTVELAVRNKATVIATAELAYYLREKGVTSHDMNLGGSRAFPFGTVKLTIAHHSSSTPDGRYAGDPSGVIIDTDGKVIYHAGDTALFYDMKLLGEMHRIHYALLPIGDNYTMGVDDSVKAAEFLNAKTVIPVHFNTFDLIRADSAEFKRKIESIGKKCVVLEPGGSIEV